MHSIDDAAAVSLPPPLRECLHDLEVFARRRRLNLAARDGHVEFYRGKSSNQVLISVDLGSVPDDDGLEYQVAVHTRKARFDAVGLANFLGRLYYHKGIQVSYTGEYQRCK